MLVGYLDGAGKPAGTPASTGASDYDAFTQAGIPSGGLFSGAEEKMTAEEAELWGGKADQPFDPNYHKKTDTLDHVDRTALEILGRGVGYFDGPLRAGHQRPQRGPGARGPHPPRSARLMRRVLAVAATALTLASCSAATESAPTDPARDLAGRVTADAIFAHLEELSGSAIGPVGTPGYEATVDYLAGVLRDRGFAGQHTGIRMAEDGRPGKPTVQIAGRSYPVTQASPLAGTPRGGVSGPSLRPREPAGCASADYGDVRGALAIVDDTGCSVVVKQNAAVAKGAVGLLVVSAGGTQGLFEPGYYQKLTLPVAVIDRTTDAALRRTTAAVRLDPRLREASVAQSRNVVAQTTSGDTANVVMARAPTWTARRAAPVSTTTAPGWPRCWSIAEALGSSPAGGNAVRFAFWGSEVWVRQANTSPGLDAGQLDDIAAYLDADMLGSQNAGFFTYDGDQSAAVNEAPDGSAGIERTWPSTSTSPGVRPADIPLDNAGDYGPFLSCGCTCRGPHHRIDPAEKRRAGRLWGGRARSRLRPQPRHRPRRYRERRPPRPVDHRTGPGLRHRHLRAFDRGRQRCPARDARHRRG